MSTKPGEQHNQSPIKQKLESPKKTEPQPLLKQPQPQSPSHPSLPISPPHISHPPQQNQPQQGQSQYTEDEQSPIQVTISSFTQFFKAHKPVLFVCFDKLKDDLQFRYDKLFQKLKLFVLREKRPYRMFVTVQNYEADFQSLVNAMQIMDLPIGTYLIFQSNFNDKGGITIEKYKNCFILKANMKKNSEFQNGYCRFGALEVYEILFEPQTLEKQENIVFDSNKELIRAAKWKGYRTFYLSDESLMDGLTEWTNLFSMQDLVFKSEDLAPLSDKIFCQMQKISSKTFQSKWKLKDTMGRSWVATADIVGYMIEPDEINFSSELVKIINNMYNSMLIKTLNVQLARLEPSVNFKFPKTVKEKVLLHYLIEESEDLRPILSIDTKFQEILKTGIVSVDGKEYQLEGLGGIILVASLFYMNQEIEKIYDSIYIKPNPQVENTMQAYIRDLRVVFNALKEINVKSQYFFDIQGKRKFSVLDINGLRFLDMNNRIKMQIIEKLNVLKNYLELREHHQIFMNADDKKLKYFQISKKAVFHNLAKRINNLVECYDGLQVLPEGDILHQIDLILKPHIPFPALVDKIIAENRLIITGQFTTDINLLMYYLQKAMVGKFKYIKVLNFAELPENKVKKLLGDCKKSLEEIIFVINYDSQVFTVPLVIHNLIINNKGQRSTLVVGCLKKSLPFRKIEEIAPKHVEINIIEVTGTRISYEIEEPQFNEQKYEVLQEIFQKFVPSHKQTFMELGKSPQFMDFLRTPSMLHQFIQLSKSIEKKKIINLNLLFKIFKQHLQMYINEEYGRSTANIVRSEIEILTTEYFTNCKNPKLGGEENKVSYWKECEKIFNKEKQKKYKRGFEYETLSFLLFEQGNISFKHEMFAAYLATQIIINNQLDNYSSEFNCIKYFLSNSMVRLFLEQKLITLNMRPKLLAMVKQSKYRAQIQTNTINCGIAASLLALLQPDLSDQDFAFCEFPDATFEGCNLTRTDFSYANMLNCYFGRANCYETLIFRCKHIGSVQFEEVIDHESINEIKQIVVNDKVAYLLVNGFLQTWQYPFNKVLNAFQKISFKKICRIQGYLFGVTFDAVFIINLETMTSIVQLRSKLLIIYDIIVSPDLIILTSNTNCMEQWKWKEYIAVAEQNLQDAYTEKVIFKHSKIFYAMKRVCAITLGESSYFYIGDAEGSIFKYDISTLNIICNYKLMKEGEVICLGFYEGIREKKLMTFTEDMYLRIFTIKENAFHETWICKQFEYLKEIAMNEQLIFAMSGHAISVYGKKYIGKPISKLNYYREDGLNFTSMQQLESSKKIIISHMKGILTVPFFSHDVWRESFGHEYSITCLLHTKTIIGSKQTDIIISGGFDMKLNFWRMNDLAILASVDVGCTISQLAVDRTYLLVASQFFYILIYSLQNFELVGKLTEFYQGSINCMRIYDEVLFTGSNDRLLMKYRTSDWKYRSKMVLSEAPTYIVCGIDYIECIIGTEYGKILWIDDRNFIKYQMSQHKTAIESIIIDGNIGFSCSSDILVKWQVKTRQILSNIIIPASIFTSMSFYKDNIMATIGNSIMFLSRDLKELLKYPVHGGKIRSVIYDEKNEKIYSAGDDRCIKKFTVGKGYQKMEFEMSVPKRLACNKIKFN